MNRLKKAKEALESDLQALFDYNYDQLFDASCIEPEDVAYNIERKESIDKILTELNEFMEGSNLTVSDSEVDKFWQDFNEQYSKNFTQPDNAAIKYEKTAIRVALENHKAAQAAINVIKKE